MHGLRWLYSQPTNSKEGYAQPLIIYQQSTELTPLLRTLQATTHRELNFYLNLDLVSIDRLCTPALRAQVKAGSWARFQMFLPRGNFKCLPKKKLLSCSGALPAMIKFFSRGLKKPGLQDYPAWPLHVRIPEKFWGGVRVKLSYPKSQTPVIPQAMPHCRSCVLAVVGKCESLGSHTTDQWR